LEKEKMKTKMNRILSIIAIVLMSTGAIAVTLQKTSAHTPAWTQPTYAYVTASPNIVGVGQYTLFEMWLDKFPPTAGGLGGDRWRGFQLDITKPDGSKQTLGPFVSGPVGTAWTQYTPDQAGTYTIVFSWPGQTLTNGTGVPNDAGVPAVGDIYQGSTSAPATLTVTQTPVTGWVEPPLPTYYWTRPINDANRGWSSLASNWLKGSWLIGNFQTEGQAPNSPHIMWTKGQVSGGIVDAQWPGQIAYADDYPSPFTGNIIMNGKVYLDTGQDCFPIYGYYAYDLLTGQQLWYKNGTDNGLNNPVTLAQTSSGGGAGPALSQTFPLLSFGQLYHYYSVNGQGVLPYLWMTMGTTWYMLSADTGNWIMTLANVPSGTSVTDQDGSQLLYSYNATSGNLLCWNSSQSIPPASPTGTAQQQWRPRVGAVIDAQNDNSWTKAGPNLVTTGTPWYPSDILPRSGYTMNVTIPKGLPGITRVIQDDHRVPKEILFSVFNTTTATFQIALLRIDEHAAPYSPMPDKTFTQNNNLGFGTTMLWNRNYANPKGGNLTLSFGGLSYNDGVFIVNSKETMEHFGFSLTNGDLIWGPTVPQGAWDMYGFTGTVAYGQLYSCGYAGTLYDYDIKTGELKWTYNATDIGYESPYGNYPLSISAIADGKVYLHSTEHSPTIPLWRGAYIRCLDATSGTELWRLLYYYGFGGASIAVADGYLVGAGSIYDNQIYCIGKGPSATTIEAPMTAVTAGSSVAIQGTVMDTAAGTKQAQQAANFPAGVPAVSDASMEKWMEYLYEQQAKPLNATGVSVTLSYVDPNSNTYSIGTTTSDITGHYAYGFTPTIPGLYTITATFAGTNSFYPSSAETSIVVNSPPPTPSPVKTVNVMTADTFYIFAAIMIVLIIAVAILILVKRK
jgi:hypothetical protein